MSSLAALGNGVADGEVLLLGSYPFYMVQPQAAMDGVFARHRPSVERALNSGGEGGASSSSSSSSEDSNVVEIARIGSSAIPGMPGTPVVDMVAVCRHVPPTAAQRAALADAGFPGPGTLADHAEGDYWWFGGDTAAASGALGRCVLHVVAAGNPWVAQAKAFAAFLSGEGAASRAAFEEYAAIKREGARLAAEHGAEGNKLSDYKGRKHDVCVRLMGQATAALGGAAGGSGAGTAASECA
jgi:GrpB-like predicted nucleotidyltransferase (UPF0157 family)